MKKSEKNHKEWAEKAAQEGAPDPEVVKALKREVADLKAKASKHQTVMDLFRIAVTEALEDLPPLKAPPMPPKSKGKPEEIAVLHISDTQIGKETISYNSVVAEKRLLLLAEKAIEVINVRRSAATINEIRVYFGGDLVEGEDIFSGQSHQIDQSVFDQACRVAPRIFAQVLLRLAEAVPVVSCKTVPGNHGRNGRYGGNQHPRTNWDNVVHEVLKVMLLGYPGNERKELQGRINIDISETFYAVDRVYDWGNLIVHGDQVTGGFGGFPWYGVGKKAWGWIDSIAEPWDLLWLGHFHTPAMAVLNHRIFLANGTTESDNTYAQAQLAAAGYPCQRLAFFNRKHGMISDGLIYLSDERRPTSMKGR